MKKTFLSLVATAFGLSLMAAPVSPADAIKVGVNFWNTYRPQDVKPVSTLTLNTLAGYSHLYILENTDADGFVILAADDCVQPVLAYAFDAPFPELLHPSLAYWLRGYEAQIAEAVETHYVPTAVVTNEWSTFLRGMKSPTPLTYTSVPALMHTRWNQSDPYNKLCPYDTVHGGRAVVGCVATAIAQIMKYWNYPTFGQGSHSYEHYSMWHYGFSLGTISADFANTTYHWNLMPNSLNMSSFTINQDAVALISFHCGVAVDMMYGLSSEGGSGAYSHKLLTALPQYFKYDESLSAAYRYYYTDSAWSALLDEELAVGQPIYYTGSDSTGGHAFVLDGSDLDGRYHFNWGWGGYGDGFYALNNLAPGSGGAGGNATYSFNQNQDIIRGIRPGQEEQFVRVDYADSICNDSRTVIFRDYTLSVSEVAGIDTHLYHLDTIFNYHLDIIQQKCIIMEPNGADGERLLINYCPATGVILPDSPFQKENCRFIGWCRRANGQHDTVQPGTHVMLNTNRRYYALWQDTTVSINDVHDDATLTLWPNPTTGEINISVPVHTGTILVIDALGRTVQREDYPNIMGGTAKISLSALPNGAYNVQVKTDRGVYNQRVIKR